MLTRLPLRVLVQDDVLTLILVVTVNRTENRAGYPVKGGTLGSLRRRLVTGPVTAESLDQATTSIELEVDNA